MLTFYRAKVYTVFKEFLEEGINTQNGKEADDRKRHSQSGLRNPAVRTDFDLRRIDLREVVKVDHDVILQRPKMRMGLIDVNHNVEPVIPMPYHRKQADRRNNGRRQGQNDF